VSVTTFEYLYGYASTTDGHFVLFGIYRPGSAPLTNIFFDELFTMFELLMTYSCPVIVCGDFNVHVDITDDPHAVRLRELLQTFGCVRMHLSLSRHTSAVTYSTLLSRQPPRTSPKCMSAACCQTTRLSISLSVLRRSGSMNNGLHAGSGVSCNVKPSRQTWP